MEKKITAKALLFDFDGVVADSEKYYTGFWNGIGKTYCGRLTLIRIDYLWTNDLIVPMTFEVLKFKQSDHYPVVMSFNVTH